MTPIDFEILQATWEMCGFQDRMFIKDYTEEDRFLNLFDSLFIYAYLHWKMILFLSRLK